MANGILVNSASSGQHNAFTFSLTFTEVSWCQFWRLLTVGCVMSDCLMQGNTSTIATTWNQLSTEVTQLLIQGKVEPLKSEAPKNR